MFHRLRLRYERLREVPATYVLAAIAGSEAMIRLDVAIAGDGIDLPPILQSTASSARVLLSTIAGATITVAGIVFAVTLVSLQLASSQFSPRVIPGFLRDHHQQQVTGFVVGTFTYCLLVMRVVRGTEEAGGLPFIPHLSVSAAVILAVFAILGILAFLDHSARLMQVGEIVARITDETRGRIAEVFPHRAGEAPPVPMADSPMPGGKGRVVVADGRGWVRHVDTDALLALAPPGGVVRLDVRNGSFVARGSNLCAFWPEMDDGDLDRRARAAVVLGGSRILLRDVAFGVRQLVDIALRALSPGVNDPTTAYEVIVNLGDVFRELLWRELPPVVRVADGRRLVAARDLSHADYVDRAFGPIREAGAAHASVAAILLTVLGQIATDLEADGLEVRAQPLRRQGRLVVATYEAGGPLAEDLARVRATAEAHGFIEPRG